MARVIFEKGKQKEFLQEVKTKLNLLSIRSINQFGIEINYSTIKNYYNEKRLMPQQLFNNLCYLAKINPSDLEIKKVEDNWGQIKGGKKGIITLRKMYPHKISLWSRKGGRRGKKQKKKLNK